VQAFISSLESQGAITPSADSSVLNASISVEEVESALLRMKNGRMAGPDGKQGELLKGAYSGLELPDGTCDSIHVLERANDHEGRVQCGPAF
jgi:hypothetical protein